MGKVIVETVYGKKSKFEIYRLSKSFGGYEFIIHKDGSYWKGTFDSLSKAVQYAQDAG